MENLYSQFLWLSPFSCLSCAGGVEEDWLVHAVLLTTPLLSFAPVPVSAQPFGNQSGLVQCKSATLGQVCSGEPASLCLPLFLFLVDLQEKYFPHCWPKKSGFHVVFSKTSLCQRGSNQLSDPLLPSTPSRHPVLQPVEAWGTSDSTKQVAPACSAGVTSELLWVSWWWWTSVRRSTFPACWWSDRAD